MDLKIEYLEDLSKLKVIEDQGIRINRCSVTKKLHVDRRTVDKYINGYRKTKRDIPLQFDSHYKSIKEVLKKRKRRFKHKSK